MRKPLLLSLVLLPLAAIAQGPGGAPPPRPVILAIDTDHDGSLSTTEIAAAAAGLLTIDRDKDGQLTSLEYLPSQADPKANNPDDLAQRLMAFDKNGDGVLTKAELPERMSGLFDRADKNKDGKITADELKSTATTSAGPNGRVERSGDVTRRDPVLAALDTDHDGVISAAEITAAPTTLKTLDKDGDGTLSAAEMRPRPQTAKDRAEHFFEEWDTNKDGKITAEEAPERMVPQVPSIDTSGDGVIDMQEATVYFEKMMQQQQQRGPGGGPRPEGASQAPPRP